VSVSPTVDEDPSQPRHVVAALYESAAEVAFVDCACGGRMASIVAWYAHLRRAGQHPLLTNIGPVGSEPLRRYGHQGAVKTPSA
jgi:hypothetical protein